MQLKQNMNSKMNADVVLVKARCDYSVAWDLEEEHDGDYQEVVGNGMPSLGVHTVGLANSNPVWVVDWGAVKTPAGVVGYLKALEGSARLGLPGVQ